MKPKHKYPGRKNTTLLVGGGGVFWKTGKFVPPDPRFLFVVVNYKEWVSVLFFARVIGQMLGWLLACLLACLLGWLVVFEKRLVL